ncbi:MAG: 16S rRNA (guanine(527)-N(7))-methyltransferase RsmG [Tissierellaceae bacterium]
MDNIDTLLQGVKEFNIDLDQNQIRKFAIYKKLLKEWNKKINITAITDDVEIDIKHFLDSLTPITSGLFSENARVIDIGTGGGFPGLPLKIFNENLNISLLDSLNKRIVFLKELINILELQGIEAIHGRAEDLGRNPQYREKYDVCISRAVASLNTLSEYCIPFVKLGGHFISMKGPNVEDEVREAEKAIGILGGRIIDIRTMKIPQSNIVHSLIIVEKTSETATKYPRVGGNPKKNPL